VKKYVIVLDRATDEERAAVQSAIKENASGWWHHFRDAWIVSGRNRKYWRELMEETLISPASAVLILTLPEPGSRAWSYYGPFADAKTKWLEKNYTEQHN
jgi:hypothetical protein